ncbi:MAG: hypothetical protein JKY52_19335 [Flavobacteriales bacterium]|nr:hypothetical protein [Flavobacteriales bacterium]
MDPLYEFDELIHKLSTREHAYIVRYFGHREAFETALNMLSPGAKEDIIDNCINKISK